MSIPEKRCCGHYNQYLEELNLYEHMPQRTKFHYDKAIVSCTEEAKSNGIISNKDDRFSLITLFSTGETNLLPASNNPRLTPAFLRSNTVQGKSVPLV